jgi:cell shape-determining protein MreC
MHHDMGTRDTLKMANPLEELINIENKVKDFQQLKNVNQKCKMKKYTYKHARVHTHIM